MCYSTRAHLKRGFTLIEIMIVIAIIAILAGIAIPKITQAREEAQLAACEKNLTTIGTATEAALMRKTILELTAPYSQGTGGDMYNASSYDFVREVLVEQGYLGTEPHCPMAPNTSYYFSYAGRNRAGYKMAFVRDIASASSPVVHVRNHGGFLVSCEKGVHYDWVVWPFYVQGIGICYA